MEISHELRDHAYIIGWPKIDEPTVLLESGGHLSSESVHGDSLSERKGTQKSVQIKGLERIGAKLEAPAFKVDPVVFHVIGPEYHFKGGATESTGAGGFSKHPDLPGVGLERKLQKRSIPHPGLGL